MLIDRIGTLFIPSLDNRNHKQKRLELQGKGGAVAKWQTRSVWSHVIMISTALIATEPHVLSASPSAPEQPLSNSHKGVLCRWPLFKSSQGTDGACIVSALTLPRWQSPLWKQERGGEIRSVQSLWKNLISVHALTPTHWTALST